VRRLITLAAIVLLAGVGVSPHTAQASPEDDYPTVEDFIAVVRGYDVATIRRTFPAYNTGLFERIFGAGRPIPLATDAQRRLFAEQLVRTPAGVLLDIGHVATGLEAAAALPPAARQVEMLSGCEMRAAVTWSGDIGQGLIDFVLDREATDPAPYYERNASDEDLYGDIDGYVLSADLLGRDDIDVAAVLTRAYLESDYEATRFRRFIAALGDDPAGVAGRQIACYAASYAVLTGQQIDRARLMKAAPYFVGRFLAFVRAGAASESAVPAAP
jgi:hypothetical protein